MDTIDISNLNRQFLFRRKHVGAPKSVVARESALLYTANAGECEIVAHHDDVKTLKYGPEFVKQFDIVLNALDNLSARRHVGRVCWSAGTPYVESGTAGWYGQVQPFIPGRTGCYECEAKTPPTTFPVCTIRSNPSKPIHTIMWAKHLFNLLFGKADEENAVTDVSKKKEGEKDDNKEEKENGAQNGDKNGEEANGNAKISEELAKRIADDRLVLSKIDDAGENKAKYVFHKVFSTDILMVNALTNLWTERAPPSPYTLEEILSNEKFAEEPQAGNSLTSSAVSSSNGARAPSQATLDDQKMWSLRKCAETFLSVFSQLQKISEKLSENSDENPGLSWDKDEPLHLDFVVAASNLRSHQYGIPMQSKFAIKSDAGNIIPAIATTNAIIAGLIVIEATKILTGKYDQCKCVYLAQATKRSMLRNESKPYKNPSCYVCSNQFVDVKIDTNATTLQTFVDEVLTKQLGVLEASIIVGDDIIYESGDEDLEPQLKKTLNQVKIHHSSIVHAESFAFDFKLEISIQHADASTFEDPSKPYKILGSVAPPSEKEEKNSSSTDKDSHEEKEKSEKKEVAKADDNDDVVMVIEESTSKDTKPVAQTVAPGTEVINLDDDDDDDLIMIIDAPPAPVSSKKRSHDEILPDPATDEKEPEAKRSAAE